MSAPIRCQFLTVRHVLRTADVNLLITSKLDGKGGPIHGYGFSGMPRTLDSCPRVVVSFLSVEKTHHVTNTLVLFGER
jgi:hypothetical protein